MLIAIGLIALNLIILRLIAYVVFREWRQPKSAYDRWFLEEMNKK